MFDSPLQELIGQLRSSPAWQRKHELEALPADLLSQVVQIGGERIPLGDDAAVIKDGEAYLLLAAEVIYPPLVAANPYLAGRSAVLANVNDVYAMGGRPLAIVNTVLAPDTSSAGKIMEGLRDGCARYGVALVGGHLTANSQVTSVAACILGRANALLTSFDAQPGDALVHVTNLRGSFHPQFPFWDCSAHLSDAELQRDLEILPWLAEKGWCRAARDISMAGILGSALMLLELSGVGATINLDALPLPEAARERYLDWLVGFPSYGFILAVPPRQFPSVQELFARREITCTIMGEVTAGTRVTLARRGQQATLWDFGSELFTGFAPLKKLESSS